MPKVIPVPDALSQPFWDAVNEKRLVLQHCTAAASSSIHRNRPARSAGPPDNWSGEVREGHIATYIVIEDAGSTGVCPISPTIWR